VATVVAVVAAWHLGGILNGAARDPLGYANASAALYVVGCTAGLMVYARSQRREVRAAALAGAALCAVVPWLDTAIAAGLLMLPLPFALLSREVGVRVRGVIALSAAAALAVVAMTVVIGAVWASGTPVDLVVAQTLSGNRAQLWREALDLTEEAPLYGHGVNRFAEESPLARADADLRWAHRDYLQLGAETGVPGFALALGLLVWAFARLAVGSRDQTTAVAAAGLAAASITASVDYVWHFPVVLLALVSVVGAGGGAPLRRFSSSVAARHGEPRVDAAVAGDAVWPQQLARRQHEDPQIEQR
jgi:O-antigen ligase